MTLTQFEKWRLKNNKHKASLFNNDFAIVINLWEGYVANILDWI